MAKVQKSKSDLEALVRERSEGLPISHLEVRPDPVYGWSAFVVGVPSTVGECQAHVERVARDLRALYDLKHE